nr:immunoglobulin heavy chain junction region [Mus musculus]
CARLTGTKTMDYW